MLVVTSTYFYIVIFMFHLPYMDVYFNLPISKKFPYIYIYTNEKLISYMYMWIIFKIGRLK